MKTNKGLKFSILKPFYLSSIIGSIALLTSCGENKQVETVQTKFCISDTMLKQTKISEAKLKEIENEIHLSGKITFDESKVIKVYPLASGNIYDIKVELGDYVQKGQVLASMHSSEIAELEKDMDVATSNLSIAEKNMDVARDLYKSGYGTEREYLTAQKEYQKVKSEITRLNEVLSLFGKSTKKSDYLIKAPIAGFIVEKNVNNDMQIRPDFTDQMFTISDLQDVWVMANVYESDISKIKIGYDVSVSTISYPDKIYQGKIDKIFNVIDPQERVMKVRIKLQNPGYELKPEMSTQVVVKFAESGKKAIAIPTSSIIFDKNRNFVLTYKDKCDVQIREINILQQGQGTTYLSEGINENEKVISESQLLIYNALNQ